MTVPPLRQLAVTLVLPVMILTGGCGTRVKETAAESLPGGRPSAAVSVCGRYDMTPDGIAWADSVLDGMTLRQKVGQVLMPALYASGSPGDLALLKQWTDSLHIGGVVLLRGTVKGARQTVSYMDSLSYAANGVIPFTAIDAEWGLGMRLTDAPVYPRNGSLPDGVSEQSMYDYGAEVAIQCRATGINMVLGPVLDVSPSPADRGVMGRRTLGSDARRVAELGTAYAMGLESAGILSVAKHFPGHGSPHSDSHRTLPMIERSLHMLDSIDLYPFRSYVASGLSCVMVGHLAVPAIDSRHIPAAVSRRVITDLLRTEMGFNGLVLTDALNMAGADGYTSADALTAGADIILAPRNLESETAALLTAISDGRLPVSVIDDRCRRILFYKYLLAVTR